MPKDSNKEQNEINDDFRLYFDVESSLTHKHSKKKKIKVVKVLAEIILSLVLLIFLILYIFLLKLPDISDLRSKASQFETLRIMDRQENLLYEIVPPDAGRRNYVTLNEISPFLLATVIAVEDKDYYKHPGFDLSAIIRAFFQNAESGMTVSGASTITQQLARNLLMSKNERTERSIIRKIKEIILSAEITRRYSKDEILEIYLNENYYGNHAYGIEAASQTYFRKSAKNLDLAESAFLAGLPQAPGYYDIFRNREAVLSRFKTVLLLSYNQSAENGCIFVREGNICTRIDPLMVTDAIYKIENYPFSISDFNIKYPHWVNYIYQKLESEYGADFLYRSGYTIYTTLDPSIQDISEQILKNHVMNISGRNVYNGAVVVINPKNGDVLAMVGSPDFDDVNHSGQVNMAILPRQPGSVIKPLIYAAAFERGWTPATLIWDVETDFSPTGKEEDLRYSPPYHPMNYDRKFHGPVSVREALASSLNIPAVKALQYVGIYDDSSTPIEDGFISFAKRMHVDSLDKAGYGLSIALGGGEVTLLELTNAYSVFANNGNFVASRSILRILDHQGNEIFSSEEPPAERVLKEEYAYQINSILSDDNSRNIGFGTGSIMNLSYASAVKTGTTNDYRDGWTIGYNNDILVGVWIGNADNSPMNEITGISGAAPVWHDVMEEISKIDPKIRNNQFTRPAGIRDIMICADTGTLPSSDCKNIRWDVFAEFQPPASENEGLIRRYYADTWSGKLVSAECMEQAEIKDFLFVPEKEAQNWIKNTETGKKWAVRMNVNELDFIPEGNLLTSPCGYPVIELFYPEDGMNITEGRIDVLATVYAVDGIYEYSVDFASLSDPDNWMTIRNNIYEPQYTPAKIAEWYTGGLEDGDYQIRIRMTKNNSLYFEKKKTVHIDKNQKEMQEYEFGNDNPFAVTPLVITPGTIIFDDIGEIYIAPENF